MAAIALLTAIFPSRHSLPPGWQCRAARDRSAAISSTRRMCRVREQGSPKPLTRLAHTGDPCEAGAAIHAAASVPEKLGTQLWARGLQGMDAASYSRARAKQARQLAETTLDDTLRDALRSMARDYDELAEDLEHGAEAVRHPGLLPEEAVS